MSDGIAAEAAAEAQQQQDQQPKQAAEAQQQEEAAQQPCDEAGTPEPAPRPPASPADGAGAPPAGPAGAGAPSRDAVAAALARWSGLRYRADGAGASRRFPWEVRMRLAPAWGLKKTVHDIARVQTPAEVGGWAGNVLIEHCIVPTLRRFLGLVGLRWCTCPPTNTLYPCACPAPAASAQGAVAFDLGTAWRQLHPAAACDAEPPPDTAYNFAASRCGACASLAAMGSGCWFGLTACWHATAGLAGRPGELPPVDITLWPTHRAAAATGRMPRCGAACAPPARWPRCAG